MKLNEKQCRKIVKNKLFSYFTKEEMDILLTAAEVYEYDHDHVLIGNINLFAGNFLGMDVFPPPISLRSY